MGLDQYLYSTIHPEKITKTDFPNDSKKITTWRNHWQLQLYFSKNYAKRFNKSIETFSLINLPLSLEDCETCLKLIETRSLPSYNNEYKLYDTTPNYFNQFDPFHYYYINKNRYFTEEEYQRMKYDIREDKSKLEEEQYKEDIEAFTQAISNIKEGKTVFYNSWW